MPNQLAMALHSLTLITIISPIQAIASMPLLPHHAVYLSGVVAASVSSVWSVVAAAVCQTRQAIAAASLLPHKPSLVRLHSQVAGIAQGLAHAAAASRCCMQHVLPQ
jgi:hypothetical protein